jgi:beta-lactamase regulating signal transducer with metallopeptidase domain
MNDLFAITAQNTIVAIVFALLVFGIARFWRNPAVIHVLWLLVLLKLVAPPLVHIDWSALRWPEITHAPGRIIVAAPRIEEQKAISHSGFDGPPTEGTDTETSARSAKDYHFADSIRLFWNRGGPVVLWFWLLGTALFALVAAMRIVRFERLLRNTLPASERMQRLTLEIACKMGVQRVPDVRYVECVKIPMLWCAGGRATIALPMSLVCQLDNPRAALILAHELAHLRRRDHWVRGVELVVSIVYWWNPLLWLIRRQMHQAEDLCCDAWVRWTFPDCRRRYAEVVLQTAESLSASQVGARLLPASQFLHTLSLKARIEMILENRFTPFVSKRSRFVIALLALLVWPSFGATTTTELRAASDEQATPSGKLTPATSEFPYAVKFEQGATAFFDGDKITVLEVRGTADTFTPGNIYWIKGTYSLASHDRATLAAYTTAMDAENATGYSFKAQTTVINQGNGTFTLFLPMSCRGWPHVSFYPADGGSGFGGSYFGTGDSVLKQWWGSKEKDRKLTSAPPGLSNVENANDHQSKSVPSRTDHE